MAKIRVTSDNGAIGITVEQNPATGYARGWCGTCQEWITDRGHHEDTVEVVFMHVLGHELKGEDR